MTDDWNPGDEAEQDRQEIAAEPEPEAVIVPEELWADDSGPLPILDGEELESDLDDDAGADQASEAVVANEGFPGLSSDGYGDSHSFLAEILPVVVPAQEAVTPEAAGLLTEEATPREMDLGPEKRVRWWPWALAALVATALIAGGVYAWWWIEARPIAVPDVVGKRPAEATQILNDVGLRLGAVSEVPTDVAPIGTIVAQEPALGVALKPGGKVALVVAAAPEQTKTPNVVGVSVEDAGRTLARERLSHIAVESHSETVAIGFVMSQLPTVGAEMTPGAPVVLIVSKGLHPVPRAVPGIEGLNESDAVMVLEAAGFVPLIARSVDPSIAPGAVLDQAPSARASAEYGSRVHVLVSQGTGTGGVAVPGLASLTRKQASERLKAKGLKGRFATASHPSIAKGRVISQMPVAERSVASGTEVDVIVSEGPSSDAIVPSLEGTLAAGATASVEASGFMATIITVEMPGVAEGTVFAQFPPAGSMWRRGYPVVFLAAGPPRP